MQANVCALAPPPPPTTSSLAAFETVLYMTLGVDCSHEAIMHVSSEEDCNLACTSEDACPHSSQQLITS